MNEIIIKFLQNPYIRIIMAIHQNTDIVIHKKSKCLSCAYIHIWLSDELWIFQYNEHMKSISDFSWRSPAGELNFDEKIIIWR